jgi:prolipoprotein diacylglyceryltransferase
MVWYVAGYTAMRFFIEGLRIDPAKATGGLRLNQWVSIVVFAAAIIFILVDRRRSPEESSASTV